MRSFLLKIMITWLLLLGQPAILLADYIMGVTLFYGDSLHVFNVSDDGDISFDYKVKLVPWSEDILFSENGTWGITAPGVSVVKVSPDRNITFVDSIENEDGRYIAISPDSKYGVYGCSLQTLRYYPFGDFKVIPSTNLLLGASFRFSRFNEKIIALRWGYILDEYVLMKDGRTTATGFSLDISPARGSQDLEITPDGKTCIALSGDEYQITSLRIHEEGGFSLVQQFNTESYGPWQVDFTPDSRYAIVSFVSISNYPDMISYKINEDSTLTQIDTWNVDGIPGEDMAVTPDGKYAVTRELINADSHFHVIKIEKDGNLTELPDKKFIYPGHCSAIDFVPPYSGEGTSFMMH